MGHLFFGRAILDASECGSERVKVAMVALERHCWRLGPGSQDKDCMSKQSLLSPHLMLTFA